MRFIGNKECISADIRELLSQKLLVNNGLTFFDACCGTGAVSDHLKDSCIIKANDMLQWCVVYTRGRLCSNECNFANLGFDPFEYFNSDDRVTEGFFYKNYSPAESNRMYFSPYNAGRIDFFRMKIEEWKLSNQISDNEYAFLLACLIESVSAVSNIAGVYGAFLKHWDPRALKNIVFTVVDSKQIASCHTTFYNSKIEDIICDVSCDILYIDPPYTQNQYGTQYHLLETLVLYDEPSISNITGSRSTTPLRSDWSKDYKAHILLDKVLANTTAKYIILSYSQDGIMSKSYIEACFKRYGKHNTYICKNISYHKYTNFKSRNNGEHIEYLFFIEKKEEKEVVYCSPLNYIGNKVRMVPFIQKHIPDNISTFIDAFGGGFNVGINSNAHRIIYNDINHLVSNLISSFKTEDTYKYILSVKGIINKFRLECKNSNNYINARDFYNSLPLEKRDPKLLFAVILYGFNQQIRFNSNHDFNNPVGMRWFNDKVLEKLISFSRVIKEKNVLIEHIDYQDLYHEIDPGTFVYLDPPYMLTNGSYNDGKRGFHGWNVVCENRLFDFADRLNKEGRRFMISYVIEHNGKYNTNLEAWMQRGNYTLLIVPANLGNNRKEIIIKNYGNNNG